MILEEVSVDGVEEEIEEEFNSGGRAGKMALLMRLRAWKFHMATKLRLKAKTE